MSKQRIEYFDVLRGGAIILVIAIHSFIGFDSNENNTATYHLAIIWRQIIGCAVPIFLAISGYFLSQKPVSNTKQYLQFLKNQIPRVYIPMLIWSVPYLLYSIYSGKDIATSLTLFFLGGFSVYYFITLIVQYYFLLPYLQKFGSKTFGLIIFGVMSSACMLVLFYLTRVLEFSFPLIEYAGPFPVWIVFFALGIYLGKRNCITIASKKLFIFVLFGLTLSVAETYFHIHISLSFSGFGIKLGTFVYSFTVILWLFSLKTNKSYQSTIWRFFVYLGKISFGVYLTHMFFLAYLVRPLINQLDLQFYFLSQFVLITLTVISSASLIFIGRKINMYLAVKYLGF